ncbi:unnamed protein product [Rotaria magnacalcarata]|uniref:Thioredoxin domain-containing protein n=1 Tax=Rotaria magnacalcarata TaxID=392030 RepID=A0A816E9L6_9BILA|nr:unnamed protein product [Rotaria magnacalcarata]
MGSCFSNGKIEPSLKTSSISPQMPLVSQSNHDSSLTSNPYVNKINEITSKIEFDELVNDTLNTNLLIVCDFYADWCPPCLQIAPTLYEWASNDYKACVIFMKIDVDQNSDLSNKFSIRGLPTFILFKQGKEVCRVTGGNSTNLRKEIDKFT